MGAETQTLLDVLRAHSAVDCDTFDLEGQSIVKLIWDQGETKISQYRRNLVHSLTAHPTRYCGYLTVYNVSKHHLMTNRSIGYCLS